MARAQHTELTITHTPPPESRIELRPKAGGLIKYSTRCLTHEPRTHLREHIGGHVTLYPHAP